jgi:DNA-binding GntR family transcriptional regulator
MTPLESRHRTAVGDGSTTSQDGQRQARPAINVERRMLGNQVRDILLGRILSGEYGPGERLVETRIARELGVSQGTVREAIRSLEAVKFIETTPFAGARVRGSVALEELIEVHPVRAALEDLAARLGVPRMKGKAEALRREVDSMRKAAAAGDLRAYVTHNASFHRAIVAAAGNGVLLDAWEAIAIEARILITTHGTVDNLRVAAERHVPIVKAIEAGDVRKTRKLLAEHQRIYQKAPHRPPITKR